MEPTPGIAAIGDQLASQANGTAAPTTPAPAVSSTSSNNAPTQSGVLDPDAVNLAKAIRQTESVGDPTAVGKSGEYGAYQYTEGTWATDSAAAGVNVPLRQATLAQQNQVAYTKIKALKDAGNNVGQIASIWNAGSGEPNAYTGTFADGSPSEGTNKYGVKYSVPEYAQSVANAYQKIKSGQSVAADPNNPSSIADTSNTPAAPADNRSLLEKVYDWAFPIVPDIAADVHGGNTKTALQQLGDAGLSALWFAPGLGDAAEGAIKGTQLVGDTAAKVAGQAIGGGAIGYGADVASNLSQGKTGASTFTPGLGTVTGGLLGGAIGKIGSAYSDEAITKGVADTNNSILGQTKRGANDLADAFSKDSNIGETLANSKVNLQQLVNPETVAYDTSDAASQTERGASTINDALTTALGAVKGTVSVDDLTQELLSKVPKNEPEQAALIQNEMDQLRASYGNDLSASAVNEWKQRAWKRAKFDTAVPSPIRNTYKMLGNTLKTKVEDMAAKEGLPGVAEGNALIGQHLDAADALTKLNGTKAKGGRLGDLLRRTAFSGVGGATIGGVSGLFGGGPVGAVIGALAGETVGNYASRASRFLGSSPIKSALFKRIEAEDPEILQKLVQYAKNTPKGEEAARQLDMFTPEQLSLFKSNPSVVPPTAPVIKAAPKSGGLVKGLALKTAARVAQ